MGKLPTVERDLMESMGITIESAAKWYLFLAEEYEMLDDEAKAKSYKQRGESLMMPAYKGYIVDANLEEEITKWTKKKSQA
jgi:hypothetical protein